MPTVTLTTNRLKIYTKTGDKGSTGLLFGGRVDKDDLRTQACGTADEAVAALGLARSLGPTAPTLAEFILQAQRELFVVGAELATAVENAGKLADGVSKVTETMVTALEQRIDSMIEAAPLPEYFIVPGSTPVSSAIDLARAVVRRLERIVVTMDRQELLSDQTMLRYLNRLSDALFAAARFEEHAVGAEAPPSR